MSTEPTSTPEPQPTTDAATATEIAARGGSDPWAADADNEALALELTAARAPRQFDPHSVARARNLIDDENAYCS